MTVLFVSLESVWTQSLHSGGRDRDLDEWLRLRQSLLVDISGISGLMPPMPPRRRKYNIDVCEEEKSSSKRIKTSIMSSDRFVHQLSAHSLSFVESLDS